MTASRPSRGQRRAPGAADTPTAQGTRAPDLGPRTPAPDGNAVVGAELTAVRTGDDTRRRGWFWHWNSIVTQYSPLLGLKGVGLLNSYTVWTDRRESSPMRGYAFPSQQSEADFYGEDRAELIAINKILVALDLVEIKKEMVLRVDEHGRRWRVPHNLYRVKDTDDSRGLTTADVLRVVELAERDAAVYRHIRRVFSARFAPIDPGNPWHDILPEVRQDAGWQRLAAKTAREEARFSARSKAGHASRKASADPGTAIPSDAGGEGIEAISDDIAAQELVATGTEPVAMPIAGDTPAAETTVNDTGRALGQAARATNVAPTNTGSGVDVAASNRGSGPTTTIVGPTGVAPTNRARPTAVAPSNTIEDQSTTTTTTTRRADETEGMDVFPSAAPATSTANVVHIRRPVTSPTDLVNDPVTSLTPHLSQGAPAGSSAGQATTRDARRLSAVSPDTVPAVGARVIAPAPAPSLRTAAPVAAPPDLAPTASAVGDPLAGSRPPESAATYPVPAISTVHAVPTGSVDMTRPPAPSTSDPAESTPAMANTAPDAQRREDEALAITAFEAANGGRVATPAEVQILRQLARQLDPVAAGDPELTTGWAWIAAAVYEAVDAGSAYVAPRRLREITARWSREGRPGAPYAVAPAAVTADRAPALAPAHSNEGTAPNPVAARFIAPPAAVDPGAAAHDATVRPAADRLPTASTAPITHPSDSAPRDSGPDSADGPAVWDAVLRQLARTVDPTRLADLAGRVTVASVTVDEVRLTADPDTAALLTGELRPLIARALSATLRRTVRLTVRRTPS